MGRKYTPEQMARRRELESKYVSRKRQRIISYLGGKCAQCGSTDQLELDHIDPATKSFNIKKYLNRTWEFLVPELDKCQLLCHECHKIKTVENNELNHVPWNKNLTGEITHGTNSGYTYWRCRCEPCRQARYEARVRCGDIPGTYGRYHKPS